MSAPQVDHALAVLIHAHGRTAGVLPEDAPERASDGDEIRVYEAVEVGTAHNGTTRCSSKKRTPCSCWSRPRLQGALIQGLERPSVRLLNHRNADPPDGADAVARRMLRERAVMATRGRLSAMDAAFLYYERPVQRLHVGSVSLLDGPVPFDAFTELTVERLRGLPRYFQRPVRPVLDWTLPSWQDVPRFDPRRHIRHVGVPPPGGDAELHALVDELIAAPLDPDSPLWETYLIDGLADGRAADPEQGPPLHDRRGERGAAPRGAHRSRVRRLPPDAGAPPPMLRSHGPAARGRGARRRRSRRCRRWRAGRSSPPRSSRSTPPSPPSAGCAGPSLSLERLLAVRGAVGCKVNDVVLSVDHRRAPALARGTRGLDRSALRACHGAREHADGRRPSHARQPRVRDVPDAADRHRRPARAPAQGGRAHERAEGARPGARDGPPDVARRHPARAAQRAPRPHAARAGR